MYKRPVLGTIVFIRFKFMKTAWKIYKEYYLYYISTKYWFNLGNIIFCLELSLGSTHDFGVHAWKHIRILSANKLKI